MKDVVQKMIFVIIIFNLIINPYLINLFSHYCSLSILKDIIINQINQLTPSQQIYFNSYFQINLEEVK